MTFIPNVLIVEDQSPVETLQEAVCEVFPRHYEGFSKENYEIVRCYNDARDKVHSVGYDFVILDHRMPYEFQQGLERKDFKAFCATLENVGYGLIPLIKEKNPNSVVIGTSSLSRHELGMVHSPDYRLEKVSMHVTDDLDKIVLTVKAKEDGK